VIIFPVCLCPLRKNHRIPHNRSHSQKAPVTTTSGARSVPAIAKRPTLTTSRLHLHKETRPAPGLQEGTGKSGLPSGSGVAQALFCDRSLCQKPSCSAGIPILSLPVVGAYRIVTGYKETSLNDSPRQEMPGLTGQTGTSGPGIVA
jgi:hypothetical protein